MFALRATVHTTHQASPSQLVFGQDAMLPIQFQANWNLIKEHKQKQIARDNQRENSKRIEHVYQPGDKVAFKEELKAKYAQDPYSGPYRILRVYDNGTVLLDKGVTIERINIRLIKPYYE